MPSQVTEQMKLIRHVAEQAIRAPSVHNTQPWALVASPDRLVIKADYTRHLGALDPSGRQLWISCGCAVFNARVAIAAAGWTPQVVRLPEGDSSDVVAEITVDRAADLSEDDRAIAALEPAIAARQTNRRHFTDEEVPRALLTTLEHAAQLEGARAVSVERESHRMIVAMLSQRADTMQYTDAAYRGELREWTTDDPARRDGVPAYAVPHVDAGSGDDVPVRDFDSRGTGALPTDTHSSRNQCMLLLGADGDSRNAWVHTGEALERMWLETTSNGFAATPLTQIVEVPATRASLRSELRLDMHPDVLLRIGRAEATPPTLRREIDDVLVDTD